MLWVYDHYNYVYSYSAGIDFSRQSLMFKSMPRCKGQGSLNPIARIEVSRVMVYLPNPVMYLGSLSL